MKNFILSTLHLAFIVRLILTDRGSIQVRDGDQVQLLQLRNHFVLDNS